MTEAESLVSLLQEYGVGVSIEELEALRLELRGAAPLTLNSLRLLRQLQSTQPNGMLLAVMKLWEKGFGQATLVVWYLTHTPSLALDDALAGRQLLPLNDRNMYQNLMKVVLLSNKNTEHILREVNARGHKTRCPIFITEGQGATLLQAAPDIETSLRDMLRLPDVSYVQENSGPEFSVIVAEPNVEIQSGFSLAIGNPDIYVCVTWVSSTSYTQQDVERKSETWLISSEECLRGDYEYVELLLGVQALRASLLSPKLRVIYSVVPGTSLSHYNATREALTDVEVMQALNMQAPLFSPPKEVTITEY
jgi:hypothetical protein